MMKKCIKIQLLTVGIAVCMSAAVLCGCDAQSTPVSFDNMEDWSEQKKADSESAGLEGEIGKDLSEISVNIGTGESEGETDRESVGANVKKSIVVYICGAVKQPGVFTLPEGSRVNDALDAAGGFAENAAVSSVNLAARLQDEEMICVLTVEEQEKAVQKEALASGGALIDINIADIDTLCGLPGIGESKARDIVMYRKENGAFQIKEDIMKVTGIKENLYKKICDLITVK